jgi:geranylgeranyl transferase type-2 subunit alpha
MTQKLAALSPDFDTVWNYRREIILHLNSSKPSDEQYKFFLTELLGLVKLMRENPKSYTLWGHRQWLILEGLKIEKFMNEEQLSTVGGGILHNEIKLCDKMLTADERNFHCWNYRSWIINTQLEQYDEIEKANQQKPKIEVKNEDKESEGDQETEPDKSPFVASEMKMSKLKEELEMTVKMIEKNFSNFSAWHYRSKLLLKIHKDNDSQYKVPIEIIKEELEKIKHAIFTEPNDQSAWNYHRWLVSLLIPVYIVNTEYDTSTSKFHIEFSEIIYDNSKLNITCNGDTLELESETNKPESKRFVFQYSNNKNESEEELTIDRTDNLELPDLDFPAIF